MNKEKYLRTLTKCIRNSSVRTEIMKEYENHITDCKEALMKSGMGEKEAEEEAVRQMGDPIEAGREMNHIYWNLIDVPMIIWYLVCAVFFCFTGFILETVIPEVNNGSLIQALWLMTPEGTWTVGMVYLFRGIGIFLLLYGLILSGIEKWNDCELFYLHARDWGGGVGNSGLILALAISFLQTDTTDAVVMILTVGLFQTLLRSLMIFLRNRRETELLWEIGVADTAVTYKGKGTFRNKQFKVMTKDEEISAGTPIMVVALKGAKPVVVRV